MTTDPGTLALVSLLLPLAAFFVLAIVAPFRRLGRPAAFFSVLCAAAAFAAAFMAWRAQGAATIPTLHLWEWLPGEGKPLATVRPVMAGDLTRAIGESVLTRFVLPFELLAFLMLAALLGAIYFARPDE